MSQNHYQRQEIMTKIRAVIFDYGFTISAEYYFNVPHPRIPKWRELIQQYIFEDPGVTRKWMEGRIGLDNIATIIEQETNEQSGSILACLRAGCQRLRENKAVIRFAKTLKAKGIRIGLVTVNFDVFNEVIVPGHKYDDLFDVIVNSCDWGEIDKRNLWPIAFERLGEDINYGNSLLIDDGERETNLFRAAGGLAIRYTDDRAFGNEIKGSIFANQALHIPGIPQGLPPCR